MLINRGRGVMGSPVLGISDDEAGERVDAGMVARLRTRDRPADQRFDLERLGDRLDSARRRVDEREEALRQIASLSPREVDVLGALTSGAPNKVVADQLSLSVRTVEMHRANLMEKLGVRSFADALRLAFHADLKPQSAG
jgi:two-component system response regulator FixJ